jgi:hypothetical protein
MSFTSKQTRDIISTLNSIDDSLKEERIRMFQSTEQTGTGSAQTIPHGLGVEPEIVMVFFSDIPDTGASYTFTKGSVNVTVTATTGAKYYVVAMA